jgi:hypothetical protein
VREQETRITFPAVFGRIGLTKVTSLEAFYQLHFEPTALNGCGTFYASLDFMAEGCDKAMFGNLSDRTAVATGVYVKRTATQDPSNSGQGGPLTRSLHGRLSSGSCPQFHSRAPFYSGAKSGRADDSPLFVPGDPGNLNPTYFTEYPEDIRMLGVSFETKIPGGAVLNELLPSDQPLQYNSVDLIIGPSRGQRRSAARGGRRRAGTT